MITAQTFACAIAWTAAIVAITAYIETRRARRTAATRWHIRWNDGDGELTTQKPLTETECEALVAEWKRKYGGGRAREVRVLNGEEQPDA